MTPSLNIRLSAIDEARFGVRVARADGVALDHLAAVDTFCRSNQVKFLIARCSASELRTIQAMEAQGYRLMDALLYYDRSLSLAIPLPAPELRLRPVSAYEAETVRDLAAAIFQGYGGHYHADPRLDPAQCDDVYSSWAYNSCLSREVADAVLVAEREEAIVGFITLRRNTPQEGEAPLYGVAPALQGHGIGRGLVIGALHWFLEQGCEKMVISTQITNLSSQKVWIRLGFEPAQAFYTFHKWYD